MIDFVKFTCSNVVIFFETRITWSPNKPPAGPASNAVQNTSIKEIITLTWTRFSRCETIKYNEQMKVMFIWMSRVKRNSRKKR